MRNPTVGAAQRRVTQTLLVFLGLIFTFVVSAATGSTASARAAEPAAPAAPKLVVVVGPTHGETGEYLKSGEATAKVAETLGFEVERVFHPNATWANVKSAMQGANVAIYLGHGNGFPSPYTATLMDDRQNGMGLNPVAGGSTSNVKYYGADYIREQIVLAPNSVVIFNRLCYASGNGSPPDVPGRSVAHQRVDNFSAGFLDAGARAVFAYGWQNPAIILNKLMTAHMTMDEIFMIKGAVAEPYAGFIDWNDVRLDSTRVEGSVNHLDPHPSLGWLRAVSGDLEMTTDEWRGEGAGETDTEVPVLSEMSAVDVPSTVGVGQVSAVVTPNGDTLADTLAIRHTVSEGSYLTFKITDATGNVVRRFNTWSDAGTSSTSWDGRNDAGSVVADGLYAVTATPKDRAGNVGDSSSVAAMVLTTMRAPKAAPNHFFSRDGDSMAGSTTLSVNLVRQAVVSWRIEDAAGNVVRRNLVDADTAPGTLQWSWNGTDDAGAFLPDGTYYSVVKAVNANGGLTQRIPVRLGAFRVTSTATSATAGQRVTFTIYSAETLSANPTVRVLQPGVAGFTVYTYKLSTNKYQATITFRSGGTPGAVTLRVTGTDANGVKQSTDSSFTLR